MPINQDVKNQAVTRLFEELKALHAARMSLTDNARDMAGGQELSRLHEIYNNGVAGESGSGSIRDKIDKIKTIIDKDRQVDLSRQSDQISAILVGIRIILKTEAKTDQTKNDSTKRGNYKEKVSTAICQYLDSIDNVNEVSLTGLLNFHISKVERLHRELDVVLRAQITPRSESSGQSASALDSDRTSGADFVSPRPADSLTTPDTVPVPLWLKGRTPRPESSDSSAGNVTTSGRSSSGNLTARIQELHEKISEHLELFKHIKAEKELLERQKNQLESDQVNTERLSLAERQLAAAEYTTNRQRLEREIVELKAKLTTRLLEPEVKKSPIGEQISQLRERVLLRIDSLNKQISDLKIENEKLNQEYSDLQDLLASAVATINFKKEQYNELCDQFSDLNAIKNRLYNEIDGLTKEIAGLKESLISARAEVEIANNEAAAAKRAAGANEAEAHVVLEQVKAERDDALRQAKLARAQVEQADNEVAAARRAVAAIEAVNENHVIAVEAITPVERLRAAEEEIRHPSNEVVDEPVVEATTPVERPRAAEEEIRHPSNEVVDEPVVEATAPVEQPRWTLDDDKKKVPEDLSDTDSDSELDTITEAGETPRDSDEDTHTKAGDSPRLTDEDDALSVADTLAGSTPRSRLNEDLPTANRHEEVLEMASEDTPRANRHEDVLVMSTEDLPRADRNEESSEHALSSASSESSDSGSSSDQISVWGEEDSNSSSDGEHGPVEQSLRFPQYFITFDHQKYGVEPTTSSSGDSTAPAVRVFSSAKLSRNEDREQRVVARVSDMFEMARRAATNKDNHKPPVMRISSGGKDLVNCYYALSEIYKDAGLISGIKTNEKAEAKLDRELIDKYKIALASKYYKVERFDPAMSITPDVARKVATQFMLVNTTGGKTSEEDAAKRAKKQFFSQYEERHHKHADNVDGGLFDQLHATGKDNPEEYGCIDQFKANTVMYNNLVSEQNFAKDPSVTTSTYLSRAAVSLRQQESSAGKHAEVKTRTIGQPSTAVTKPLITKRSTTAVPQVVSTRETEASQGVGTIDAMRPRHISPSTTA